MWRNLKNVVHLEKCRTNGKMRRNWKNMAQLKKCGASEKMRRKWSVFLSSVF